MAIKKNNSVKSNTQKAAKWFGGKIFKRSLLVIVILLAGGLLFNLDRLGNTGINLLKVKEYLPSFIVKFLPGGNAAEGRAVPEEILDGQVIEIYDGDTLTLLVKTETQDKKYKVRFFGIDAPEADQDYGKDARNALREKILGKNVRVSVVSVDRYGRSVGKVMFGGRYINKEMVAEGNAWYYPDYAAKEYDLASAEKDARSRKLGLWQNKSPQEPWLYRKINR